MSSVYASSVFAAMLLFTSSSLLHPVASSCVTGSLHVRLEDCPLEEVHLHDGDSLTLRYETHEWSLPLFADDNLEDLVADTSNPTGETFSITTKTFRVSDRVSIPAPIIRIDKGATVSVNLRNDLDAPRDDAYRLNVHTHGLHVSPYEDDSTVVVYPGESHEYVYRVPENHAGGTHWYHPHINTLSETAVSGGAAGMMIIEDAEDGSEIPAFLANMEEKILIFQRIQPRRLQTLSRGELDDPFSTRLYVRDSLFQLSDNAPEDDEWFPYYLVNGFLHPSMDLERNKWYRLRMLHVSAGNDIRIFATGGACTIKLLAKDGVYLPGGPRDTGTEGSPMRFTPATRVDVAIRCTAEAPAHVSIMGMHINFEYEEIFTTLMDINVVEPTSPDDFTDFSFTPCLPRYLPNLLTPDVVVANADKPLNITISPFTINERFWAGFDHTLNISEMYLGEVHEWQLNHSTHAFHAHINHFQIVDRVDEWDQAGDWVDTLQSLDDDFPIRFRFLLDRYPGRVTMHCHNLDHADEGAMSQGWIHRVPGNNALEDGFTWAQDCPNPITYSCSGSCSGQVPATDAPTTREPTAQPPTDQPTTMTPTKFPTTEPTEQPTKNPTTAAPTNNPPTATPTNNPTTTSPTTSPPSTAAPTKSASDPPTTASPTIPGTQYPTFRPTPNPTAHPTNVQGGYPTNFPTVHPTPFPTFQENVDSFLVTVLTIEGADITRSSDTVAALESMLLVTLDADTVRVVRISSVKYQTFDVYFKVWFSGPAGKQAALVTLSNLDNSSLVGLLQDNVQDNIDDTPDTAANFTILLARLDGNTGEELHEEQLPTVAPFVVAGVVCVAVVGVAGVVIRKRVNQHNEQQALSAALSPGEAPKIANAVEAGTAVEAEIDEQDGWTAWKSS